MPIDSQKRPLLSNATQQAAATALASIVSQQFAADVYDADFVLPVDDDRVLVDSEDGDVVATIPLAADLIVGKPYIVEKSHADNSVTVTFSGSETLGGNATIVLAALGDSVGFIVGTDGLFHYAFPQPLAAAVPAGALAIDENLADLDDPEEALINLDSKVYLTAKLSLVGATADEIRLQSPVHGAVTAVYASQIKGPIATGAATTTLTVGGAAPTANTLTHSIAEAAGQKKTMSPTGPNTVVAPLTEIRLAVTGTNDAATSAAGYVIEITRAAAP